jgi:hypothetical protein
VNFERLLPTSSSAALPSAGSTEGRSDTSAGVPVFSADGSTSHSSLLQAFW